MGLDRISVGTAPNDKTGDSLRDSFIKVNTNSDLIEALLTTGFNKLNFPDLDPSTTGTPSAGYYYLGMHDGKIWTKDETSTIKYFWRATNQANSTATTIFQMQTDFNNLLTKLKAAGLMEAD